MRLRQLSLAAALVLIGSICTPIASQAATPKSGGSCSKVGSVTRVKNQNLVCTKIGKRLLWRIKVNVVKPIPTPAPTTTPTPTPTTYLAPIPITLPVAPRAITFGNIISKMPDVAGAAFDDVRHLVATNPIPMDIKATVWVGPNTTLIGPNNPTSRFDDIMKVAYGFAQPKVFGAFLFSTVDEPAAEIAFAKWVKDFNVAAAPSPSVLANECHKQLSVGVYATGPLDDCINANAGIIDIFGTGMALMGVPTAAQPRTDPYRAGALENHEYVHMLQGAPFVDNVRNPGGEMQRKTPCWLGEGMAHFVGKSSASLTLNDYLKQRNGEAKQRTNAAGQIPPREVAGISQYLSLDTLPACVPTYDWGYATGMLVTEALAAIGGVQSLFALYALEARGLSFSDAFKGVYGISWSEAQPILANVVANDYLLENMSR